MNQPLLTIRDLAVSFGSSAKGQPRVQAVDRVSLAVYPAQTLAVVGESGSGKSVSALSVLQLIPTPPGRYDRGQILWRRSEAARPEPGPPTREPAPPEPGAPAGESRPTGAGTARLAEPTGAETARLAVNLLSLSDRDMRRIRGAQIAMIFQEPMTSLNPVYTIGEQIMEAVLLHQHVSRRDAVRIAAEALEAVGIADPEGRLKEYPHQLSGGMRQRVMIAMALACRPELLLADEPTTALDVTIQAQILELLRKLQRERGMAVLLITHDLGVVAENADTVAVMYAGRICEFGNVMDVFGRPLHPYTRGLLASMPVLGRTARRLPTVSEGASIPDDFPPGYRVAPHEPEPDPEKGYGGPDAYLHEVEPRHWVLCEALNDEAREKRTFPSLDWRREELEPQIITDEHG